MSHTQKVKCRGEKKRKKKEKLLLSPLRLPSCALCWWKSHNRCRWCQGSLSLFFFFGKHFMLRRYEKFRCIFSPLLSLSLPLWQQRWLWDKGIYIKLSLYIVLVLYILGGETATSACNILLINGNKKRRGECLASGCSRDPFFSLCTLSSLCALSFVLVF